MFSELKKYCKHTVPFSETELSLIDIYFEARTLNKKEFLLQDTKVCNFIGFIAEGSIRHFHIKDGVEKTCDISFENSWVTDFQSFTSETTGKINLQPMEVTTVFLISKVNLYKLYQECNKYETFGGLWLNKWRKEQLKSRCHYHQTNPKSGLKIYLINNRTFFNEFHKSTLQIFWASVLKA